MATAIVGLSWVTLPIACGKSAANDGGADAGTAPTFDQRNAALDAIVASYEALPHQSMDADNQAMLVAIQMRPELTASRLTTSGTVAARFTDGPGFVFINNLDDSTEALLKPARAQRTARGPTRWPRPEPPVDWRITPADEATLLPDELPEGGSVFLLNGLSVVGAGNPLQEFINAVRASAHIDKLAAMFGTIGGYQVTKGFASIANLEKVQDADVFYFIGHGGHGLDENGAEIFVLSSSDAVSSTHDLAFKDDIAANLVGYAVLTGTTDANGQRQRRAKKAYYITPRFIAAKMFFNKYSFVLVNGCVGAAPLGADLQNAFLKGAHASAYAAWDWKVNSADVRDSAEYLFDRLLGAQVSDVPGVKQTPPVRPSSLGPTMTELSSTKRPDQSFTFAQSLDSDPMNPLASLIVSANDTDPSTFDLLAPSIELVNESASNQLTIFGWFGSDPGDGNRDVTINGVAQTVAAGGWTSTQITCDVDPPASGMAGPVRVTVRDHQSNPRELTGWSGKITLTRTQDGVTIGTATFDVVFRIDVGNFRSGPQAKPVINESAAFAAANTAQLSYSVGGTARDTPNHPECMVTYSMNGSPKVPYQTPDQPIPPTSFFEAYGFMHQRTEGNLTLDLVLTAQVLNGQLVQSTCSPTVTPSSFSVDARFSVALSGYDIPAGSTYQQGLADQTYASWGAIAATGPPTSADPL
jgi:hypothetical protein